MSHPFFREGPRPSIFGHRGFVSAERAAAGIVENSREAIAEAFAAGAEYVESDCQLTGDGRVVLFHDARLTRVLGDPRPIRSVSHAQLAELMEPRGGLLTLEEALTEFPAARFNIDMKSAAVAEPGGAIVGALAPGRVLIGSFSDRLRLRSLAAAEAAASPGAEPPGTEPPAASPLAAAAASGAQTAGSRTPAAVTRPATSAGQSAVIRILAAVALRSEAAIDRAFAGIDALQIPERQGPVPVLTERLLRAAHARGVEVHVWTVNDAARMRALADFGVDGIITDRTDLAMAELRAS